MHSRETQNIFLKKHKIFSRRGHSRNAVSPVMSAWRSMNLCRVTLVGKPWMPL